MSEAPISLYLALKPHEMPDLEVVARASIAWNDMIKELISIVEPGADVRVEFVSGTIGSRSINSILRTSMKVAVAHPWTAGSLAALAGVFLLAPANHIATDITDYLAKEWFDHEDSVLTAADVDRVARRVVELERNQVAVGHKAEVYRQAERDTSISGIGATPLIGQTPSLIVPRSEFPARIGSETVTEEEDVGRRERWKRNYAVTIVRSYSKGEPRRWRFEAGRHNEFSATMRDPKFLEALRSGHTGIEIGEGVEIRIDLRIKEERVGGVWEEKEMDVMKVVWPFVDRQGSLQFVPDQPGEAGQ